MDNYDGPSTKVEVLTNIFAVEKGILKVLLFKKNTDPYKGYWMLPHQLLGEQETIEECSKNSIIDELGINSTKIILDTVESDIERIQQQRVIGVSLIGLIDTVSVDLQKQKIEEKDGKWFEIESIPKTIYDHKKIINNAKESLKNILSEVENLRAIFPSDFTLPELQKIYEQVFEEELDRRNFRKKLISLDILESTGENNIGFNGRPAKLYRLKDNIPNKKLF